MTDPVTPVAPVTPVTASDAATPAEVTQGPSFDYVGEGGDGTGAAPVPTTSNTSGTAPSPTINLTVPVTTTGGTTPITSGSGMTVVPPITTGPPAPVQPNPPAGGTIEGANTLKLFGREPTLWIGVISSLIIVAGTAGFHLLTGQEAALVVVAINAIAGAINAYAVRPISPVAFTYAIGSIVAVAGAYGLNLSIETVAGINAAIIPILALLTRNQVSPQATAVSAA